MYHFGPTEATNRVTANVNRARGSPQYKTFLKFALYFKRDFKSKFAENCCILVVWVLERLGSLGMCLRASDNYISFERESGNKSLCVLLFKGWWVAPAKIWPPGCTFHPISLHSVKMSQSKFRNSAEIEQV